MPPKERLLRIAVSHYKSPDVSEAEFHRWAVEEHCAKVARLHAKHKVVAYGMLFSPRSAQEVAQKLNLHLHGRWKIDDHDVQVIFYMRSLEDLTTALADPEFVALQHEETPFVSTSGIVAALGWEEVYVQDGKVVNLDDEGKPEYAGFHVQADFSDDRFVSAQVACVCIGGSTM